MGAKKTCGFLIKKTGFWRNGAMSELNWVFVHFVIVWTQSSDSQIEFSGIPAGTIMQKIAWTILAMMLKISIFGRPSIGSTCTHIKLSFATHWQNVFVCCNFHIYHICYMYCKSLARTQLNAQILINVVRKGSRTFGCVCIFTNGMTPAWSSIRKQTECHRTSVRAKHHMQWACVHCKCIFRPPKNKNTTNNKFVARYQHVCIGPSNRRRFNVPARVKLSKMKTLRAIGRNEKVIVIRTHAMQ